MTYRVVRILASLITSGYMQEYSMLNAQSNQKLLPTVNFSN